MHYHLRGIVLLHGCNVIQRWLKFARTGDTHVEELPVLAHRGWSQVRDPSLRYPYALNGHMNRDCLYETTLLTIWYNYSQSILYKFLLKIVFKSIPFQIKGKYQNA